MFPLIEAIISFGLPFKAIDYFDNIQRPKSETLCIMISIRFSECVPFWILIKNAHKQTIL